MDIPLMANTPGITTKRFTRGPLGDEGELTPGPDDANPFRGADDREVVEAYKAKFDRQQRGDTDLYETSGVMLPFTADTKDDPSTDPDPYVFDDVSDETDDVALPFLENPTDGPLW
jgi:hypothetical protein